MALLIETRGVPCFLRRHPPVPLSPCYVSLKTALDESGGGQRGGADGDVVEVGLALPPTALHALSLSSTYVSLKTTPDGGEGIH